MKRFAVVGSISSGKSSVSARLAEEIDGALRVGEPLDVWRQSGFLQAFYENMTKYGLPFQMFAFATRQASHKRLDTTGCSCVIADAHVVTDRHVFAENLLTKEEMSWYSITFDEWATICPESKPDAFLYLKVSPETCFRRKNKRIEDENRTEEVAVSLDYLKGLHSRFEALMNQESYDDIPIHVIDGEATFEEVIQSSLSIVRSHLEK